MQIMVEHVLTVSPVWLLSKIMFLWWKLNFKIGMASLYVHLERRSYSATFLGAREEGLELLDSTVKYNFQAVWTLTRKPDIEEKQLAARCRAACWFWIVGMISYMVAFHRFVERFFTERGVISSTPRPLSFNSTEYLNSCCCCVRRSFPLLKLAISRKARLLSVEHNFLFFDMKPVMIERLSGDCLFNFFN